MTRAWSISLLLLLTLPMAAPATAPIAGEARWDSAPVLSYRTQPGDTLETLSVKALGDPGQVAALAAANGLKMRQPLRVGKIISFPSSMLRRDMLKATVTSYAGDVRFGDGLPLGLGSTLQEGDVINIGANSFATLDMGVAGRVTLPSQTRMRIAALHKVALTGRIERRLETLPLHTPWLSVLRESVGNGGTSS